MDQKQYKDALSSIKASESLKNKMKNSSNQKKYLYHRYSYICIIAFVCIMGLCLLSKDQLQNTPLSVINKNKNSLNLAIQLPNIVLGDTSTGGFGFEGYYANQIEELPNGNPWQDRINESKLPVYKNHYTWQVRTTTMDTTLKDKLIEIGSWVAKTLELEVQLDDSYSLVDNVSLSGPEAHISVEKDRSVGIYFNNPQSFESEEDLIRRFGILLGEDIHIEKNDDDISYYLYQETNNIINNIVGYVFKGITVNVLDGQYVSVQLTMTDLSECLGYYPIINKEEATNLLMEGKCYGSFTTEGVTLDNIAKVNLIYRNTSYSDFFIPYYQFFVEGEDPAMLTDTTKQFYRIYYVPAIESHYIDDFN